MTDDIEDDDTGSVCQNCQVPIILIPSGDGLWVHDIGAVEQTAICDLAPFDGVLQVATPINQPRWGLYDLMDQSSVLERRRSRWHRFGDEAVDLDQVVRISRGDEVEGFPPSVVLWGWWGVLTSVTGTLDEVHAVLDPEGWS